MKENNKTLEFTCKTCGGHILTVSHVWTILAGPDTETWQEWGILQANHLWQFEFKEKLEEGKIEEESAYRWKFEVYTKDNSSSKPEEYEEFEPESNPGNDKYFVNCAGCDREIEFGWSAPNRGGGIFPVESPDFIPGNIWPEPRYLESWHQKHWLNQDKDSHER